MNTSGTAVCTVPSRVPERAVAHKASKESYSSIRTPLLAITIETGCTAAAQHQAIFSRLSKYCCTWMGTSIHGVPRDSRDRYFEK